MYSFSSRVRYSECDEKSKMTLSSLVNYFQDCSTFHSESLNLGASYWEENHSAWVLSYWHIMIDHLPALGEEICIGTWVYDFSRFTASRNFILKDKDENVAACANTFWVYIDRETEKFKRITEDQQRLFKKEPAYPMEETSRKVKIPSETEEMESYRVQHFCIDTNNHVNNEKYILMAMEYLPKNVAIRSLRVEYKRAAVLGDMIYPYVGKNENKITVMLGNKEKKPYAVVEFLI